MLKIFMTGDNHIGSSYADHTAREIIIKKKTDAFEKMVAKANEEKCDIFVITGDLFDKNSNIAKKDIKTVINYLSAFDGTVFILPGNHDYYDGQCDLWKNFEEIKSQNGADNIAIIRECKPYSFSSKESDIVIYPAPCDAKHSEENKIGWMKEENIVPDRTYRIGIAHGAIEGKSLDNEGRYYLMTKEELESIPVDAWLIGHMHVPFPENLSEEFTESGKIFNAGSHVQQNIHNNTEGLCFIIEIGENKKVKAKKFLSGGIRFYRPDINLSAGKMEKILERELSQYEDGCIIDKMELSGAVSFEEYDNRFEIIEKYCSRFAEYTYKSENISKLISKELIDSEFAETSLSAVVLSALLEEPKEAQLVYELLGELKGEKRK